MLDAISPGPGGAPDRRRPGQAGHLPRQCGHQGAGVSPGGQGVRAGRGGESQDQQQDHAGARLLA